MRRQRGFSLIELLIVVAIILIIAAIAIPNMIKAKISANEADAVACIRTINTAETTYSITYPTVGYADSLFKLGAPTGTNPVSSANAGLLDWVLGCAAQPCPKSGYQFAVVNSTGSPMINTYEITATPIALGTSGNRGFCSNQLTAVTYDPSGGTNCTKPIE